MTITVGDAATIGEKEIKTNYPVEEGLTGGTQKQTGRTTTTEGLRVWQSSRMLTGSARAPGDAKWRWPDTCNVLCEWMQCHIGMSWKKCTKRQEQPTMLARHTYSLPPQRPTDTAAGWRWKNTLQSPEDRTQSSAQSLFGGRMWDCSHNSQTRK